MDKLEKDIDSKIRNAGRGTDLSFWENLLETLRPEKAKQRLKELHQKFLKMRLDKLRADQLKETKRLEQEQEKMQRQLQQHESQHKEVKEEDDTKDNIDLDPMEGSSKDTKDDFKADIVVS